MEDQLYLVGEPVMRSFNADTTKDEFFFPAGQIGSCRKVLQETRGPETIRQNLRAEYLAIVCALQAMGVAFRLVYAHEDKIDKGVLLACIHMGAKLIGFGQNFFPPDVIYPRDFCTVLSGPMLVLLNNHMQVLISEKNGWKIVSSPYGEGGRVLVSGNTMVVCEKLIVKDGQSIDSGQGMEAIEAAGMRVGFFPPTLNVRFSVSRNEAISFFSNDHIDRAACLLKGRNGRTFLVVDPKLATVDWSKPFEDCPWTPRSPRETRAHLRDRLSGLGIEVCWPSEMAIPYSLNMVQFPDGRVLMTGGDPEVRKLIADIVGPENVFVTSVPIRYFPAWLYAGIRCLVSEAPTPIIKKAPQ